MVNRVIEKYNQMKKLTKKGFTLMELVVVIGIMAILALVMVPNLTAYIQKAEDTKVIENITQVFDTARMVEEADGIKFDKQPDLFKEKVMEYANLDEEDWARYYFDRSSRRRARTIRVEYKIDSEYKMRWSQSDKAWKRSKQAFGHPSD